MNLADSTCIIPALALLLSSLQFHRREQIQVLAGCTGAAVTRCALTGVRLHSSNKSRAAVVTGNVRVRNGVLTPMREKRVKTLLDKVLIVLKALVALLELIRQFID